MGPVDLFTVLVAQRGVGTGSGWNRSFSFPRGQRAQYTREVPTGCFEGGSDVKTT